MYSVMHFLQAIHYPLSKSHFQMGVWAGRYSGLGHCLGHPNSISDCMRSCLASASGPASYWCAHCKTAADSSDTWVSVIHMGDSSEVSGSWLWPGSSLEAAGFCRENQQMEDLFLLLCFSNQRLAKKEWLTFYPLLILKITLSMVT